MMGNEREVAKRPPLDVLGLGDSDLFSCEICCDLYESAMVLVPCGHSYCGSCASSMSKCAKCQVVINQKLPNYTVRDIIARLPMRCPGYFHEEQPDRWEPRWKITSTFCSEILSHDKLEAHITQCTHANSKAVPARAISPTFAQLQETRRKRKELQEKYKNVPRSAPREVIILD